MKLKKKFVPFFCLVMILGIFGSILCLGNIIATYLPIEKEGEYKVIDIIESPAIPVNIEQETKIIIPYIDNSKIVIDKHFYDAEGDIKMQEESIIIFEKTYIQSTGIYYKSDLEFNVVSVLDGVIQLITEDQLLGNIVEIAHDNNIVSVYQSINNIQHKVGDEVNQGDIIGSSGHNKINNYPNNLLFEIYYNGNILNPENVFNKSINEIIQ